jgi:glycosyltransferase involved in cell wall biosynthesis
LISVIIPIFNVEPFLARGLDSILAQSYRNLEIICVDDGSPDNSVAILKKYAAKDPRIKIIRQKNMGVATARNNGVLAATGDYVHFFDPDDTIDSDYYEIMLGAAESARALVAVSGFWEESKREIIYKSPLVLSGDDRFSKTFAFFRGMVWRYLIRRDFIIKNKLQFPKTIVMEDLLFVIKMLYAAESVAVAPDVMYQYRINETGLSGNKSAAHRAKRRAQYLSAKSDMQKFAAARGLNRHLTRWYHKLPVIGRNHKKRIVIK